MHLPFIMICIVITLSSIKLWGLEPLALIKSDGNTECFAELISFDVARPFLPRLYNE